jgi:hypothetical protein
VNLFILRHGLAVERGTAGYAKDADRPLTPKGERKLWQIAEAMEALKLSFDVILASPYLRARQTAELVAEGLGARKRVEFTEAARQIGGPDRAAPQPQAATGVRSPGWARALFERVGFDADFRRHPSRAYFQKGRSVQTGGEFPQTWALRGPGLVTDAQTDGPHGVRAVEAGNKRNTEFLTYRELTRNAGRRIGSSDGLRRPSGASKM